MVGFKLHASNFRLRFTCWSKSASCCFLLFFQRDSFLFYNMQTGATRVHLVTVGRFLFMGLLFTFLFFAQRQAQASNEIH